MKSIFCIVLLAASFTFAQAADRVWPQPLQADGVTNFFKLSDEIYSGAAPEGEQGFATLKKLGIKTIITVDGAKPDVATAKKFGLRYVHLPFGYDGIPTEQAFRLVKAARELPKPIYVHCHHGQHRGPAGAAVICEGTEHWNSARAIDWLKQAGTSTNYPGLYKSVATFHQPTEAELRIVSDEFPEISKIPALAETMVEIDGRFDNLKLIKKAGYQTPATHPDLSPANEAVLLDELFKELIRSPECRKHGADFRTKLLTAEKSAEELKATLESLPEQPGDADEMKLSAAYKKMAGSCTACHKAHRN